MFSPRSPVSLCGLAHTARVQSSLTFMARYVPHAPPTRTNSSVQMNSTAFELPIRSGGLLKKSWQSLRIYLNSTVYNIFCFLSQKLFVQICFCVSGSGINNCCHSSRIKCGLYPSIFVYVWCGSILRDA